jgi:hypothetical protein
LETGSLVLHQRLVAVVWRNQRPFRFASKAAMKAPCRHLNRNVTTLLATPPLPRNNPTSDSASRTARTATTMMVSFIRPLASCLVMQPRTQRRQRIQLWMIRQDHQTASKPARLAHDGTPILEQLLQAAAARSMAAQNIACDPLLRNQID